MDFIVVYDKKTPGNPIIAVHSQRFTKANVTLKDIHPEDDPAEHGVVIVPGEVIHKSVLRKYKRDRKGKVLMRSVMQERSKDLVTVADSALGENILVFGEPYAEILSATDLAGKRARTTAVNPEKGVIGVGNRSGQFTVVCQVDTGTQAPEIVGEEKNWEWDRDREGNIVGMKLLKEISAEPQE
jgi:hypothetical protein